MDIKIISKTEIDFIYNDLYYKIIDIGNEYDGHETTVKDVDFYIGSVFQEKMTEDEKDEIMVIIVNNIDHDEYYYYEATETYIEMLDMDSSTIAKRHNIIYHISHYIDIFMEQEHYEKIPILKQLIIDVEKELEKIEKTNDIN